MSRSSNTDSRRAQIVSAMLPVLARNGYGKATVVEIARQAGLTPGLIHYHFASKRDILVSLVHSMVEVANARLDSQANGLSALQRLKARIDSRLALGEGANADMAAAWVMIGAEAVREPEVRAVYQEAVAAELSALEALVRECLADAGRDTQSAPRIAAALVALMEGAFQLASAAPDAMPRGYAAEAAFEHARLSVEAAPPRKPARPPRAAGHHG
jgi:TetR/AcrR family transcriptional regulator, transcriptional repressor of bet genes